MFDLELDIEELLGPGKGSGVNRSFLCPFHDERHPSMSVHMDSGFWICFGCGERGGYEKLCRAFGKTPDAEYKYRKAVADANTRPEDTHDFSAIAESYHHRLDTREGSRALDAYLNVRPISKDVAESFGVGWDGANLTFPYWNAEHDRVSGIKLRHPNGSKSAYSNSKFGLYHPEGAVGKNVVFVGEGESDTMAIATRLAGRHDFFGWCGTSGASVSRAQWSTFALVLLFASRVYLCYDADDAGDACAEIAMSVLGADESVRLRPTRGKDISEHILHGGTLNELGAER